MPILRIYKSASATATATATAIPIKKISTKKTYSKIGQTKETPCDRDPLCIFYTSLLQQNPNSKMALQWCLERGLLSKKKTEEAILVLEMTKKLKL